ncbi:hypothetical protein ACOQNR_07790, partial [Pseudomonas juntendi]|uniref:hypothetical protein n=1 Tax=Pseudomonas juntendi TaxID=2666183 RepID=UPI003B967288
RLNARLSMLAGAQRTLGERARPRTPAQPVPATALGSSRARPLPHRPRRACGRCLPQAMQRLAWPGLGVTRPWVAKVCLAARHTVE